MNIINITLGVDTQPCSSITLGRRGENEVTQVVVDFSSWVEEFGAGVITLLAMRSKDTSAYPVVLTLDGNTATWDVTSTDTAYKGSGRAEYIYTVGEQIAKSVVFGTTVLQDIGEPSETPPDPYEDWLERLTELGAETQANAEAAQQSAENAAESAEDAAQSAASVEGAVEQAEDARDAAMAAQVASEAARDAAQTAQASAEASATVASDSADSAAGSASDASASATAAGASATAAGNAATQAEAAKTAAQTAQSAAEDAAEDAQQAAQQAHVEYEQLSGEVDDLSDEVAQQKSAIDDLTALTNRKAGMLVDTASGSIASFVPDSTIDNLLGVTVDIEPVQDLHGYDAPWPAGGGANIAAPEVSQSYVIVIANDNGVSSITRVGNVTSNPRAYFTKKFEDIGLIEGETYTAYCYDPVQYGYGCGIYNGSGGMAVLDIHTSAYTFVYSASTMSTRRLGIWSNSPNDLPLNTTIYFHAVLVKGSTAPSAFVPYENRCPISGWDAVEVVADGVNLLPNDYDVYSIGSNYSYLSSVVKKGETARFIFVDKDTSVDISGCAIGFQTGVSQSQHVPTAYNWAISNGVVQSNKTNISFRGDVCDGVFIYPKTEAAFNALFSRFDIMVVLDSTATDYKPFAGNRYTIALGDTVYGAKLDVAAGTLTVEYVKKAITSFNGAWGIQPSGNFAVYVSPSDTTHIRAGIKSSMMKSNIFTYTYSGRDTAPLYGYGGNDGSNQTQTFILPGTITSLAEANAWLAENPTEATFKLATPIEIQLDPVTIATVANQTNNVWADAGDVSVEFAADLKHYIDSKIAAAVAAMS